MNDLRAGLAPQPQRLIALWLIAALFASGCSSPSYSLRVDSFTITPEPVVGRIFTLRAEVVDEDDQPYAHIWLAPRPEEVQPVRGNIDWTGTLAANRPQIYEVSLCIVRPGSYIINLTATTAPDVSGKGSDALVNTTVVIVSDEDSAQIIPSSQINGPLPTFPPRSPTATAVPLAECKAP